ncbi:MAG: OB-fold domain-containing protein [Nocardioides sp.]|uniref:Zn-ribbon domain-containing OB-fold protein n=1 Tax=Nocardioides sp. TaxID=35761 RepID=UPI0039E66CB8
MTTARSAVPTWFDADQVRLTGLACPACRSIFFPPTLDACRNPGCSSETLEPHALANRGRVWSWTRNHYQPPAPYVAAEPFEPYTVLAVELEADGLVVLGQLSPASRAIEVGDWVSLRSEPLLEDESGIQLVWRWSAEDSENPDLPGDEERAR